MDQSNVKYCPNCGAPFVPPQKFCIQCGHALPTLTNAAAEQHATPASTGEWQHTSEPKAPHIADETAQSFTTSTQAPSDAATEATRTFTKDHLEAEDSAADWSDEDWPTDSAEREEWSSEERPYADDLTHEETAEWDDENNHLEREVSEDAASPWHVFSDYAKKATGAVKEMAASMAERTSQMANHVATEQGSPAEDQRQWDETAPKGGGTAIARMLWLGRGSMIVAWIALLLGIFNRFSLFIVVLFLVSHFLSKFAMKRYTALSGDYKRLYHLLWRMQWTVFVIMIALLALTFAIQFIATSIRTSMNYALNQFHWPDASVKELLNQVWDQIRGLFGGGSGSTALPNATSTSQPLFENAGGTASSGFGQ